METIGAREQVALPELGLPPLMARIDTGARTSSLHVTHTRIDGEDVCFDAVADDGALHACRARLIEWRWVKESGSHATLRPVIRTAIALGTWIWHDEVTLADREGLRHRMLLGRRSLAGRFMVDVSSGPRWRQAGEAAGD